MKQLLGTLLLLMSVTLHAQKNTLLDRSFWKSRPTLAVVEAEVAKGNNPSQSNASAFDPVVLAINEGAPLDVLYYLLDQKGNDVNKITHDARTYLFWAASKGNVEVMDYLKSKGAKTDLADSKGYSILTFAAANGQPNTKVYDFCINNGLNPNKEVDQEGANALLLVAPYDKDLTLINYFISKGVSIKSSDSKGNTAFNYAAKSGSIPTLKALIEKGVKYNNNAMIMASQGTRNHANTIELYHYLESLHIKPDATGKNGENVFHALVRKENQGDVIKYFISKGVNVNQADTDGTTPLMIAASYNKEPQIVELLVNNTKDINTKNKKGVSALAFAVKNNNAEIVKLLVDKGADINATDAAGENVASYLIQSYDASKKDVFEAKITYLKEKGFDLKTPQLNGNTLYHLAVAKNDVALFQILKPYSIDVNARNNEGLSALHMAALVAQNDAVLKYLISIGAQKTAETEFKETAFDLASENEFLTKNNVQLDFLK